MIFSGSRPPSVSVIVPSFRDSPFHLLRAVRSVFDQRYKGLIELVLVFDHAFMPDPVKLIRGMRRRGPWPFVVKALATGIDGAGPSVARNLGIRESSGEIIAMLDSDDAFADGRIDALAPLAALHGIAFSNNLVCSEGASHVVLSEFTSLTLDRSLVMPFDLFSRIQDPMFGLYRRDALGALTYREDLRLAEDVVFNLQAVLANGGKAWMDAAATYRYTVRDDSLSHAPGSVARMLDAYRSIIAGIDSGLIPGGAAMAQAFRRKQQVNDSYAVALQNGLQVDFQTFVSGTGLHDILVEQQDPWSFGAHPWTSPVPQSVGAN